MTVYTITMLFVLGFLGAFISGLVGVGGAIINYPLLLYVPPLIGIASFGAHEITGIVAAQVFFSTLAGVLAYRKGGYLNKKLIISMGGSVLVGSVIGSFGSNGFSEHTINVIYGVLALLAVFMMFLPKKQVEGQGEVTFNITLAGILAFVVGVAAGVVGAGGSFLLVPIMLVVLKIPTRITIASSLAITFISSIGSVSGKLVTHQIPWQPTLVIVIASLIAAPIGAKLAQKMNTRMLQNILAILIMITAIKIWLDVLGI
ncbi:sulfite exporter TauE/SafE family protein [Priestia koreensis]|uniref:sulfite exporter TauE/SafE family protein n=1 Tax=Priestia koreensis TaxID=284581 RepID=UPI001F5AF0C5|nr:sulfite exporter TauE/SafE family protein [Priestia koreensis]MCM3005519.1 sulfite exporter TauE/SafE family protein [Priestia koreensis]UNL86732.1 sulfite exporter TauE/SafE family protein [Priestia koreensis]